jgi:2-aminoethylphosphonate-pyruvate transaminase
MPDPQPIATLPAAKDKLLFTPGPLTTSLSVKQAMLHDYGSRDGAFIEIVRDVRRRLLEVGGVGPDRFAAIPMQGSGTFGLESVFASTVARGAEVLVAVNGAYGRRHVELARTLGITAHALEFEEDQPVDPGVLGREIAEHPGVTHVVVTHCETTTGLLNPLGAIAGVVGAAGRRLVVDAMSSFGGIPIDMAATPIDYLVSSANKCIEGVPGFSFVIARLEALGETRGWSRSVTMDLLAQHEGLERDGQFRFTPPTGVIAAFHQALLELEAEGGVAARAARYGANHRELVGGMTGLGFECYLPERLRSHIITTFRYPSWRGFSFERLYTDLSEQGYLIYPGKLTRERCFRVGTIGRVFPADVRALLGAIHISAASMR